MTTRDVAAALARTKVELLAEVLRRCMGVAQDDNARQDFGDLNGGTLQRPTEVAAELLRALGDEGLTVAALASAPAAPGLDMPALRHAITNIALRNGVTKDPTPPLSVLHVYGYSRATPDMDAEIAAEYARLAATEAAPPAEERTGSEPPYRWPNPSTLDGPQKTAAIHERLDARYCFIVDCDVPWHAAPPAEDVARADALRKRDDDRASRLAAALDETALAKALGVWSRTCEHVALGGKCADPVYSHRSDALDLGRLYRAALADAQQSAAPSEGGTGK